MAIEQFKKNSEHYFLSNMFPVGGGISVVEGFRVNSGENIYQSKKFVEPEFRTLVLKAIDGYKAKKIADSFTNAGVLVRPDWDDFKIDAMRETQALKFAAGTKMAQLLLATGSEELIQGNTHGDTFWGVSPPGSNNGENWLGRILMEQREELRIAHKAS